ncbi:ATP-grasp domain-containing protein [Candidatus Bathyarchaeota archaeon]|nr:ATP-grasp domain-containing protein [Candidatus Bathyarchaeota archaeon]MBS7612845.1 ATP-grasp domain-containing protein [Candidatus Bathyarchaeota archaeon]MBS7617695.1 ATP-grasp domain-containing protein [Candidatus Bathyarchaeota archaeon]
MQVLLVEAILSGLFRNVTSSILSEGLAMASSLIRDFSNVGYNVSTVVCRDFLKLSRFLSPSTVRKISDVSFPTLRKLAQLHDLTYVIAPEDDWLLARLLEELDGFHICSNHETVRRVSDKAVTMSELSRIGLKIPKTLTYTPENPLDLGSLKPPFVVKPRTGTGCEGLKVFQSSTELKRFLLNRKREFLIQEFVKGIPASISLLTDDLKALPISLNRQFISISRSMYLGGYTPMHHRLLKEAFKIAVKAVEPFKGLKGYVGIDVILSKDGVYVIEINPRLTVSYIGLSRSLSENPSNAIIETGLGKACKFNPNFKAICYFKKTLFEGFTYKLLKQSSALLNIMASPPIPIENVVKAYGFIATVSDNFTNARAIYFKILEELQRETGCKISW